MEKTNLINKGYYILNILYWLLVTAMIVTTVGLSVIAIKLRIDNVYIAIYIIFSIAAIYYVLMNRPQISKYQSVYRAWQYDIINWIAVISQSYSVDIVIQVQKKQRKDYPSNTPVRNVKGVYPDFVPQITGLKESIGYVVAETKEEAEQLLEDYIANYIDAHLISVEQISYE